MFEQVKKWWPRVVVNRTVLHESSTLSEVGIHAKWCADTGLCISVIDREWCPSDVESLEVMDTSLGQVLNLVLKDSPGER